MKIVISEEQLKTLVHLIKEDNGKINVMFVGDSHSAGNGWTWNYLIAKDHLGSSFNILKSNGYKEWKNKNNK
jgi:hypothetical protein